MQLNIFCFLFIFNSTFLFGLNFRVIFLLLGALMNYFWGQGRLQKSVLRSTNVVEQLFIFYNFFNSDF